MNLVVYKYLLEAGLAHSAFTLYAEAALEQPLQKHLYHLRSGHLVGLVEKGLVLQHIEKHIHMQEYHVCTGSMDLLLPHVCAITSKVQALAQEEKDKYTQQLLNDIRRSSECCQAELERLEGINDELGSIVPASQSFYPGLQKLALPKESRLGSGHVALSRDNHLFV